MRQQTQQISTRAEALDAAKFAVTERGRNYGTPENNFDRIARFWNLYLDLAEFAHRQRTADEEFGSPFELAGHDVAAMMVLMKVARLVETPHHLDSWIDIVGYGACGVEVTHADRAVQGEAV